MPTLRANINPELLQWARERADYPMADVTATLKRYPEWELGEAKPTINQLRDLAGLFGRPIAFFFLDAPPEEAEAMKEMRRLPGAASEESAKLTRHVHKVLEWREITLNLYEDVGERPPQVPSNCSLRDDPEVLAPELRERLGISIEEQAGWTHPHQGLGAWRGALESMGILVFQVPSVPIKAMRGFALVKEPLPVIGFNSADSPRARVFTVLHEFGHILLRDSVLHAPQGNWFAMGNRGEQESFCNRLAAAMLLPKDDLRTQAEILGKGRRAAWNDAEVSRLVSRYGVSPSVVVRRLREMDLIRKASYDALRRIYDAHRKQPQTGGGGDFYATKTAHLGGLMPRLAFRSYYNNKVTASDLSAILGAQVKNLGQFEYRIFGANYGFEIR